MIKFGENVAHVDSKNCNLKTTEQRLGSENEYREKYIDLVEAIFPVVNKSDILSRIVMISNNLFEAERGAMFWFKEGRFTRTPQLKATVNISEDDIFSDGFASNYELVLAAFKKNHFVVDTYQFGAKNIDKKKPVYSAISLPLTIRGKLTAVLYHDRLHTHNGVDFFIGDNNLADQLIRHISSYVEYGLDYRRVNSKTPIKLHKSNNNIIPEKDSIIYKSRLMSELIQEADRAAASDTSVLIVGETGVGKELLARRIHTKSNRKKNPFVTINATTIPEGLFESELFGHEKGAFTGAEHQKKGLIEIADGGTLFIDEVGEMPLHMQVKLLRAIQEKSFYRVGGTKIIQSDFRLVTATNSDLLLEACEGRFREDLYYRLNLFSFTIPPLRDRGDDVLLIARAYLNLYGRKYCKQGLVFDSKTQKKLLHYPWPGNVRELRNVMERAVIMSSSHDCLKLNIQLNTIAAIDRRSPFSDDPTLDEINRRYIQHILGKTQGKISGPGGAAEILDIGRTTLTARMRRLGMR